MLFCVTSVLHGGAADSQSDYLGLSAENEETEEGGEEVDGCHRHIMLLCCYHVVTYVAVRQEMWDSRAEAKKAAAERMQAAQTAAAAGGGAVAESKYQEQVVPAKSSFEIAGKLKSEERDDDDDDDDVYDFMACGVVYSSSPFCV